MTESVTTTNERNFDKDVLNAELPVLVDFYADWCAPCKAIAPIVEDLAAEYDGKAVFKKVNVDRNAELTQQFGIRSIPTLLLFKNGKPVDSVIGNVAKDTLSQLIDQHVPA